MNDLSLPADDPRLHIDDARIRLNRAAEILGEVDIDIVGARGVVEYAIALADSARHDPLAALRVGVNDDRDSAGDEDRPDATKDVNEGYPAVVDGVRANALDDARYRSLRA